MTQGEAAARRRPDRLTGSVTLAFGGMAGVVLFCIMMLTVVDVVGRYLFNAPLAGGYEITQFAMAVLIYAALPVVCIQESHVTIDLLDPVVPEAAVRPRQIVISLVCAAILGVVAWSLWVLADRIAEYRDVTEYLRARRAPVIYYMSVLSGIGAVVLLANAIRYVRGRAMPSTGII